MFRKLKANEIDARVATVNEKGASLLLYKDARVDQNILDETVGPLNWKRSHQIIDGRLYCTVELYNDKTSEWVSKQDVGTESMTEKEKGQASDSFKRACFNWGIGRELYSAPFIWINTDKLHSVRKNPKTGKLQCFDKFEVRGIEYNEDGDIIALEIYNDRGEDVFTLGKKQVYGKTVEKPKKKAPTEEEAKAELEKISTSNGVRQWYGRIKEECQPNIGEDGMLQKLCKARVTAIEKQ